MNTYRIINVTERLEKRHPFYSTTVELKYVDEMLNKKISLAPNNDVYLQIDGLPITFYRMKIDGLIQIIDVTGMRLGDNLTKNKKEEKSVVKKKKVAKKPKTQAKATTGTTKASTATRASQTTQKKTGVSKDSSTTIENISDNTEKNE